MIFPPDVPDGSASSVDILIAAIARDIQTQGYHLSDENQLAWLWNGDHPTLGEKLRRLRTFAESHGWQVTGGNDCKVALFQTANRWTMPLAS